MDIIAIGFMKYSLWYWVIHLRTYFVVGFTL